MAENIPKTMRALALTKHCNPDEYNVADIPVPQITQLDEILVRVKAASINPIDVKLAGSMGKLIMKAKFPYLIGFDLAGIIVSIGSDVKSFKVGDEVFSRTHEKYRGTVAQYAITTESICTLKPKNLSFVEAAAVPLVGITALQALDKGEKELPGGLKGKTVFVPAGLSGTGCFAVQMAKNCFGAGKTITTLSTSKIAQVESLLGSGTPDLCVDYTQGKVVEDVGEHTVDFMFDTQRYTLSAMSVMKKGGQIVSISTVPNGTSFKMKNEGMPTWLEVMMNLLDWVFRSWASWKGVGYEYFVMEPKGSDLERLRGWCEEGKVRSVVGEKVWLSDIRGVRAGCQKILEGKGGVGKFVVEIDD